MQAQEGSPKEMTSDFTKRSRWAELWTLTKSLCFQAWTPTPLQIKRGLCEKDEEEEEMGTYEWDSNIIWLESMWKWKGHRITPIQRRDHISTAQGGCLSANSRTNQIFYHSDTALIIKEGGSQSQVQELGTLAFRGQSMTVLLSTLPVALSYSSLKQFYRDAPIKWNHRSATNQLSVSTCSQGSRSLFTAYLEFRCKQGMLCYLLSRDPG